MICAGFPATITFEGTLLVTTEPIGAGHIVSNIKVDCNQSDPPGPLPNTNYQVSSN